MTTTPRSASPDDAADAARTARELRSAVGQLRRRLLELSDNRELTPSQTALLSRLGKHGPATASALATAERVRPQSVAATLGVLEERGYVVRTPDPDDGRRQLVSLTPDGQEVFEGRRQAGHEWLTQALRERLDADERRTLAEAIALMERLTRP
ncbi:MarR family transcriptional regulator [Luteimicrobium xylanilyticum]|uniref:Putative HTH-type transcriptional regulator n=1 Tax=Luteimicrobium xylanilyticum TaxID=1133546 RepID=A0A5P9QF86_9MICO|nr:MarR family transcriptional regulator [Luteimicrobium xylanilyticum]QFV00068.1 putative HTH-type transcriptional regulator [Luteimicrobium xylanilyticum]